MVHLVRVLIYKCDHPLTPVNNVSHVLWKEIQRKEPKKQIEKTIGLKEQMEYFQDL